MPITNYSFENRVFFALETGFLDEQDASEWATRLMEVAQNSSEPVVALVDARTAIGMSVQAEHIFIKASFTPNLAAVVVIANPGAVIHATTIKLLGQPGYTRIFGTEEQAQAHVAEILNPPPTSDKSDP